MMLVTNVGLPGLGNVAGGERAPHDPVGSVDTDVSAPLRRLPLERAPPAGKLGVLLQGRCTQVGGGLALVGFRSRDLP